MKLSKYWLKRWSTQVRLRDDFTCFVCGERHKDAHAHHIKPKCLYPEKAYELDNGITVCPEHHLGLVHTTNESWTKWVVMFRRYVKLADNRRYNEKNQHKTRRIK